DESRGREGVHSNLLSKKLHYVLFLHLLHLAYSRCKLANLAFASLGFLGISMNS
ncbi:hypothetical protein HAX54_030123, partial [Datura stramonium]|nr:hypothetical protein [Datura stramonium]